MLPVSPPPVEALAGRTLAELLLVFIDKGGDQAFHLLFRPVLQGLVALKAEGKGAVVIFEVEGLYHLAELKEGVFSFNPQGLQPPQPHQAALKDLPVPGQHHPSFGEGLLYQGPVIVLPEEEGVIAHHAKQAGQLPYIHIHQKLHGISWKRLDLEPGPVLGQEDVSLQLPGQLCHLPPDVLFQGRSVMEEGHGR